MLNTIKGRRQFTVVVHESRTLSVAFVVVDSLRTNITAGPYRFASWQDLFTRATMITVALTADVWHVQAEANITPIKDQYPRYYLALLKGL